MGTENSCATARCGHPDAKMLDAVIPVILSGGAGTRLWPLSREQHPKQFIAVAGERSLLQATLARLAPLGVARPPIVVCNDAHRFAVREQLRAVGVDVADVVLEPEARNTAPAIAAAALEALSRAGEREDPILLVLPADHVIEDVGALSTAVRTAVEEAAADRVVAFGVVPDRPETGYGYIKSKSRPGRDADAPVRDIARFVEKPNAPDARAFLDTGGYLWNSGMFVFRAARYLDELETHAPDVRAAVEQAHRDAVRDLDFLRLDAASFARSPAISVDHAVMERTANAVVVALEAGWSDVGSWSALANLAPRDAAGNAVTGDVVLAGTRDTYVRGGSRLVAAVGVSNLIVVDTDDAVLVADRGSAEAVRDVVDRLRAADWPEQARHRRVYRPWGFYEPVYGTDGVQVKRLCIDPGGRLSLQVHRRRSEHWVVVRGVASVTRSGEAFEVAENESTYIPAGTKHRIENRSAKPLEVIEVQCGDYLGEDDIVRFEDAYGRA